MTQKLVTILFLLSAFSVSAQADHRSPGSREFTKLIEQYKVACISSDCEKPFNTRLLYRKNSASPSILSRAQIRILERVASTQAKIWDDTILESEYVSDKNTVLEKVVGIYKFNTLVAYKVSYAEKGWDVSNCHYDAKVPESLDGCPVGVIRETSFVSLNFGNFVRNHDDIADFYQNTLNK